MNKVLKPTMDTGSRMRRIEAKLVYRQRREAWFKALGAVSITVSLVMLAVLFTSIIAKGYSAFVQTHVMLDVSLAPEVLGFSNVADDSEIAQANYARSIRVALRERFPGVTGRQDTRRLYGLISSSAEYQLREMILARPSLIGTTQSVWVQSSDDVDMFLKGYIHRDTPEAGRRISDQEIAWIDEFTADGRIEKRFNRAFFTNGDSRDPEMAGIRGALMGSLYTMLVTLLLSFPLGVATAIYLEEFAPRNRVTDIIEVNINNLAAVPSIVFGLLGLAAFLNFMELPRSAPLVGGLVLTLMTLPTVIIASRSALQSVPPSIRDAALGVGASRMQCVAHHVLPLAMPGMLTGTIIGMARALGETAPLLMIGMVAFIVDIPAGIMDKATALPVQIYLWADSPERAFVEKTSAATMVLLGFLVLMNAVAIYLRRKFEIRW